MWDLVGVRGSCYLCSYTVRGLRGFLEAVNGPAAPQMPPRIRLPTVLYGSPSIIAIMDSRQGYEDKTEGSELCECGMQSRRHVCSLSLPTRASSHGLSFLGDRKCSPPVPPQGPTPAGSLVS